MGCSQKSYSMLVRGCQEIHALVWCFGFHHVLYVQKINLVYRRGTTVQYTL